MSISNNNLKTFQQNEAKERRLRKIIEKLSRQLEEEKNRKQDLIKAVERAAKETAEGLVLPKIKPPKFAKSDKIAEIALVVLSDVQLGKTTPSYNTKICEDRINKYADKILSITDVQRRHHPVHEARIYMLGDLIEGELIFPGQAHSIDASMFRQVMIDGPRIFGGFINKLLAGFQKIHIVCIPGNHGHVGGRVRKDYNLETNSDRMLYFFLKEIFKSERRITWNIPYAKNESGWYAVDHPFNDGFLLWHGHQISGGFAGYAWYGLGRRIYAYRGGAIKEPFKYSITGHFHVPVRVQLNAVTAWGNGSVESDNLYAQEQMAACGSPTQLLLYAYPNGVSAEYWVKL